MTQAVPALKCMELGHWLDYSKTLLECGIHVCQQLDYSTVHFTTPLHRQNRQNSRDAL